MAEKYANRRQKQKAIAMDKNASPEERMQAQFALQKFPKNSARCRIRNRCKITGRSRSYYVTGFTCKTYFFEIGRAHV